MRHAVDVMASARDFSKDIGQIRDSTVLLWAPAFSEFRSVNFSPRMLLAESAAAACFMDTALIHDKQI